VTDLDVLLHEGCTQKVFSHARAVVRHRGVTVFDGGPASAEARFDLASVTKVMSTTALLIRLAAQHQLALDAPLRRFLPKASADVTLTDLAFHRSGLPAFKPFFAEVARSAPHLFDLPRQTHVSRRAEVRRQILDEVVAQPVECVVGQQAIYSDLGYLLLGAVIEQVTGLSQDAAFTQLVAQPLRLAAGYRRVSSSLPDATIVSTGGQRPREPAPGQEGQWTCPQFPPVDGEVDDDNAWVMDGVAGHAGLFATASEVAAFGQAVLDGWLALPGGFRVDPMTPGSTRAFGFDTPSAEGASCGPRFGRVGPRGAIGHLGFTGTSLWIDLDRQLVVTLLTNRVVFGRANVQIRAFRPRFHETVLDGLGL
jgi:CubicO group peptidase (beta-lactamase class C family)